LIFKYKKPTKQIQLCLVGGWSNDYLLT